LLLNHDNGDVWMPTVDHMVQKLTVTAILNAWKNLEKWNDFVLKRDYDGNVEVFAFH